MPFWRPADRPKQQKKKSVTMKWKEIIITIEESIMGSQHSKSAGNSNQIEYFIKFKKHDTVCHTPIFSSHIFCCRRARVCVFKIICMNSRFETASKMIRFLLLFFEAILIECIFIFCLLSFSITVCVCVWIGRV